jgi:4-hydroxy-3-polyprenylbenzoate decarboxylase
MHESLLDFITALEHAGELRRIKARVSPVLEISRIADLVSKSPAANLPSAAARRCDPAFHGLGGHALLFENVEGSDFPVLINAWGSYRRMELALGCEATGFEGIGARLGSLAQPKPPASFSELIDKARELMPLLRSPPRRRSGHGACQQVITVGDDVDLRRLPLLRCWPLDGRFEAVGYPPGINDGVPGTMHDAAWNQQFRGRYVTLGQIHTIHADDIDAEKPSSHNIGMYRVQLLGQRTMAMHWHLHHDGARHWRSWKKLGKRMPVAIVLGGESVLPYAATAPLPPGMSELLLAGFLNGGGIPMVRATTVPLWIPANAEIVIEGWVSNESGLINWDPRDENAGPLGPGAVFEGPFGDHTGFYSLPDRYPVLEVSAITHRRNAIYPTTIVGLPPQEDYYLGKATERIFLPLLKTIVHDIVDYDLPMFGAFHNCACIAIDKAYPFQARRVMHSVWGAGQMAWTKTVIVVDTDVDVHDAFAVLRAVGEHCVPGRDIEMVQGPLDILDHAAPFLGAGTKVGLDATRKTSDAETYRALEGLAKEACAAGPINAVMGAAARAAERRLACIPGVLSASIPEELGGWWLLIRSAKSGASPDHVGLAQQIVKAIGGLTDEVDLPRWTIIVGPDADAANIHDVLFHWLAQSSPRRDRFLSVCGRRIAFDATPKLPGDSRHAEPVRAWPPILAMDDATSAKVTSRWREYFGHESP